ncbi:MAG: porin [Hyphomonas sp.]|jgi:hypothetical protein|nr:porin [Hyphomonas sp.]
MRHPLTSLALVLAAVAAPASAQDVWDDAGGIETDVSWEAAAVAATDSDESFLYTLRGAFAANLILDNGAEVGLRTSGGIDRDNPARPAFVGILGPAQPLATPPGAFSGLSRGPAPYDAGFRGRVETAYIYIEGGYGELRAGLDEGVAARFFEGAPTLFRQAALVNPALDPYGRVIARTDHDLTGPSVKVSYASPRILGLRAGASFTPEANTGGLDRDPTRGPDIENATEVALNLSRRLPRSGVRLRAAAGWSEADASNTALPGVYETVETWSAGGSVEFSSLALGTSWLDSSSGLAGPGGDYTALSTGLRMTFGKVDAGLEWVDAEERGIGAESETIGLSLGRNFGDKVRIVGGWQRHDTRFTGNPLTLVPSLREQTDGIVLEITLSG